MEDVLKAKTAASRIVMTNNSVIEAIVKPFRKKIFNELFDARFSLPLEHLHEIGKISDEDFRIGKQKRDDFENRTGGRDRVPRRHDNSRSPRSSSFEQDNTTPPPPVERPSGSGQGNPPVLTDGQEINEDRQRNHTSGDHNEDEDSDHEEAAAPIELNDDDIKMETPPEPAEPEAMQTSPIKDGDVEPTPQLETETVDAEMSTDLPTTDMDVSTGLPEVEA